MKERKLAVVGSRTFSCPNLVKNIVSESLCATTVFISGGAKGVDVVAEEAVNDWNRKATYNPILYKKVEKHIYKPEWDKYGKAAGFIRNEIIIKEADSILVFWDGKSKGTKHDIDLAIKYKKPMRIYVRS